MPAIAQYLDLSQARERLREIGLSDMELSQRLVVGAARNRIATSGIAGVLHSDSWEPGLERQLMGRVPWEWLARAISKSELHREELIEADWQDGAFSARIKCETTSGWRVVDALCWIGWNSSLIEYELNSGGQTRSATWTHVAIDLPSFELFLASVRAEIAAETAPLKAQVVEWIAERISQPPPTDGPACWKDFPAEWKRHWGHAAFFKVHGEVTGHRGRGRPPKRKP